MTMRLVQAQLYHLKRPEAYLETEIEVMQTLLYWSKRLVDRRQCRVRLGNELGADYNQNSSIEE